MKKKVEELYDKLPSKWEEVTVADFIKLSAVEITESGEEEDMFVGAENILKVISVLTETSVENLEALPIPVIGKLSKKLDFMSAVPVAIKKTSLKVKSLNEISYGDYILFQQFGHDFMNNLPLLIPSFIKNEMTGEEVLKLNMVDAYTAFFLQRKALRKSVRRMKVYLRLKLLYQRVKEWMNKHLFKLK